MKVGIFGGVFDPIHVGHLIVAEEARQRLGLERVVFVPTGQPWHKAGSPHAAAEHRLAMTRSAIMDNPHFEVSAMEVQRHGPSYTVDTLVEMHRDRGPGSEFYLLLGVDALAELPHWKEPTLVVELCQVVGMSRPGHRNFSLSSLEKAIPGARGKITLIDVSLVDVSSTDIRERVTKGHSIRHLVPLTVEEYIREHRLYIAG